MPQNNQNLLTVNAGELRRTTGAPDETGRSMPPEAVSGIGGMNSNWVYGDPGLGYGGQAPSAGVSDYTISGSNTPGTELPGGPDNDSMPIQGLNGTGRLGSIASAAAQSQRMKNPVDMAGTHMPADANEAYQASLRSLLDRNVGYFVIATFLVGPQQSVTWQGILHTVGSDYIVLYQPDYERYISGDLYSLKFVQFHNVKGVPYCAASQSWQGQSGF